MHHKKIIVGRMFYMSRTERRISATGHDHVMVKGLKECPLFRDNMDKEKYLELLEKYKKIHPIKIYAYCIMTSHAHLITDSKESNLSSFMKSVNQSYAIYYNKKYNRIGHVFHDRFKNKPIHTDKYMKNLSLYIHRNPKDMKKYKHNTEKYKYSSLPFYLSLKNANNSIVNPDYVLQLFDTNLKEAKKLYLIEMNKDENFTDVDILKELETDKSQYKSDVKEINSRFTPEDIVKFINNYSNKNFNIHLKYDRNTIEYKALSVLLIRYFCNCTYKTIGHLIGNMTSSNVSRLCKKGLDLIDSKKEYIYIFDDLLSFYA
jgi:REP element-mobilizing transposase RayT